MRSFLSFFFFSFFLGGWGAPFLSFPQRLDELQDDSNYAELSPAEDIADEDEDGDGWVAGGGGTDEVFDEEYEQEAAAAKMSGKLFWRDSGDCVVVDVGVGDDAAAGDARAGDAGAGAGDGSSSAGGGDS